MRYLLENRETEPEFKFYVKENNRNMDYYLFNDYEEAYRHAKTLSLTCFPIAIIREPFFRNDEWYLDQTHVFVKGVCHLTDDWAVHRDGLHAKFYTDAGRWLNSPKKEKGAC